MISPARYSSPGRAESTDFLGMATNLGAIRALHKPFKPNDLLSAVRESIASCAN